MNDKNKVFIFECIFMIFIYIVLRKLYEYFMMI